MPTRWNSTLDMIEYAIEYRAVFDAYCCELRLPQRARLDRDDWQYLLRVKDFLKPFKRATEIINGAKYVTLSLLSPVYDIISKHIDHTLAGLLEDDDFYDSLQDCKSKLEEYVDKKSDYAFFATILDPRFKHHGMGNCCALPLLTIYTLQMRVQSEDARPTSTLITLLILAWQLVLHPRPVLPPTIMMTFSACSTMMQRQLLMLRLKHWTASLNATW